MDARELLSAVARSLSESLDTPDATCGLLQTGSDFTDTMRSLEWSRCEGTMCSSLFVTFMARDGSCGTLTLVATKSESTNVQSPGM